MDSALEYAAAVLVISNVIKKPQKKEKTKNCLGETLVKPS